MPKKNRNTKGKIVSAAWRLFYRQGYDDTTIDEIIEESGTSRGSFYHYFEGKDALLSSLSYLFDQRYRELEEELEAMDGSFEKLMFLNRELFDYIENNVSLDLLARLYSSQLITKGESISWTITGYTTSFSAELFPKVREGESSQATLRQTKS